MGLIGNPEKYKKGVDTSIRREGYNSKPVFDITQMMSGDFEFVFHWLPYTDQYVFDQVFARIQF